MGLGIIVNIPRVRGYSNRHEFSSSVSLSSSSSRSSERSRSNIKISCNSSSASSRDDSGESEQSEKEYEMVPDRSQLSPQQQLHYKIEQDLERTFKNPENKIIDTVQNSIIGVNYVFEGPFGRRRCIYLDQTASGRCVSTIEDFIKSNVMPVYGNTHTTTSYCASQISAYREESREIVKKYCGGGQHDEVIYCGSGATAAIHKLVHSVIKPGDRPPFVILGPYEHHSNVLPWREITKDVTTIGQDSLGLVDLVQLEQVLKSISEKPGEADRLIIGSFSAGSNVTGALTDDVAVTVLLHKYGAFSFWDYAAAAPHVQIQMNPKTSDDKRQNKLARKDAIVFSGHKFLGGPQTPGVLVAKKHVLRNSVPHGHGGGTVLFVTRERHQYVQDHVERNEGGTPDIIGSIRLGLVCQMQASVGIQNIVSREGNFVRKALNAWGNHPEIRILGHKHSARLPIISFMIQHLETGLFLHQDFVVALLNDLFGVQCRSGCMCAGPFAQDLLGIDSELAREYEDILSKPRNEGHGNETPEVDMVFKPGFVRMSLPYHEPDEEITFSINAIIWIAKNGWMLLPFYKMDPSKGTFRFNGTELRTQMQRKTIRSFSLDTSPELTLMFAEIDRYPRGKECLDFASKIVESIQAAVLEYQVPHNDDSYLFHPDRLPLRWFLLPSEALQLIEYPSAIMENSSCPFQPKENYKIPTGNFSQSLGSVPNYVHRLLSSTSMSLIPFNDNKSY